MSRLEAGYCTYLVIEFLFVSNFCCFGALLDRWALRWSLIQEQTTQCCSFSVVFSSVKKCIWLLNVFSLCMQNVKDNKKGVVQVNWRIYVLYLYVSGCIQMQQSGSRLATKWWKHKIINLLYRSDGQWFVGGIQCLSRVWILRSCIMVRRSSGQISCSCQKRYKQILRVVLSNTEKR